MKYLHLNEMMINIIKGKKVLCLVDGEHYPPVTRWALQELADVGAEVKAILFLGGTEKVKNAKKQLEDEKANYKIYVSPHITKIYTHIEEIIRKDQFDTVVDLSDEPVVDYMKRFRLASRIMKNNLDYLGADFYFKAPVSTSLLQKPSIAIIGTGKRIGKTAIGVSIARILKKNKIMPVVVCMGRGGPEKPDLIDTDKMNLSAETLMEVVKKGGHAASDYWEDAFLAGVPTIGCRRCGGGMAGNPFVSNVHQGVSIANKMKQKLVIMEGSGSTFPPVQTDKRIVLIGANQPLSKILHYLGQYRIMISDFAIVTMCEEPMADKKKLEKIKKGIKKINPEIKMILTKLRPEPLQDISHKKVFFTTTASEVIRDKIINYLEQEYSCEIVGYSSHLSNRKKLKKDLEKGLEKADVLLSEIKAASIDVASTMAAKKKVEVIYLHNKPVYVDGDIRDLDNYIVNMAKQIVRRE